MKYEEFSDSCIFTFDVVTGYFRPADTYEVFLNIEDEDGSTRGVAEVFAVNVVADEDSESGEQVFVWLDDNGEDFEVYDVNDDISFSVYRMVRDYLGCY